MATGYLNNPMPGSSGLEHLPIPPPAEAWRDMLERLNEAKPAAPGLLPGAIINVDGHLLPGITSLFGLLLLATVALLFTGWGAPAVKNIMTVNDKPATVTPGKQGDKIDSKALPLDKKTTEAATGTPQNKNSRPSQDYNDKPIKNNASHAAGNNRYADIPQSPGGVQDKAEGKGGQTSKPMLNSTANGQYNEANHGGANSMAAGPTVSATNTNSLKPAAKKGRGQQAADDSSAVAAIDIKRNATEWQFGLSWKAQLPVNSASQYFTGPNGKLQPYRLLFPAAWAALHIDETILEAEINPFASTVYNPKPFLADEISGSGQTVVTKTQLLNKLFGVSAALRYSSNIKNKWYAGGGVQAVWFNSGVETIKSKVDNNGSIAYNNNSAPLNDTGWQNISKFRIRLDAQILYVAEKWVAGLRAGVYYTPLIKNTGQAKNPLETELFFRWKLWSNRNKVHD